MESFSKKEWYELLRFTSTEKECCNPGDRIPTVFLWGYVGYIMIHFQVGDNGNYQYNGKDSNTKIQLKTWTKVEIQQYPDNGKVMSNTFYECSQSIKYLKKTWACCI